MNRFSTGLAFAALAALPGTPASAWGGAAHQEVTLKAVDALPRPLKGYYQRHRREMPSLAPGYRSPEHSLDRRFAVDRLVRFPFRDLPRTEPELAARFGDTAGKVGRLPWLVAESYARLVLAMKGGDKTAILTESDALGAVIADLHDPLALTENADGQLTGQPGLFMRFSERFPSRASHLKIKADGAHLIDDPNGHVFSIIASTYIWVDNILYADDLAHQSDPGYTGIYYEALEDRAGTILSDRLGWAARNAASYWYTAWTAAGRPELR